jgi:uncharacterized coiled-coil DUF342 family protein
VTDDERIREFIEFRAETKVVLAQFKEVIDRLRPLQDARSGERMEIQALVREVGELRQDGAATRAEITSANKAADARMDRLEGRQKRTVAIFIGVSATLQVVGGLLMWALNAGLLKIGVP